MWFQPQQQARRGPRRVRVGLALPCLPRPAALPAEKRLACFSTTVSPHAGPALPAFSSWWFGEECTKAIVVFMNTRALIVRSCQRASWAVEQSQPSPKLQKAMSTSSVCLNSAWRPQGPWGEQAGPQGLLLSASSLPP